MLEHQITQHMCINTALTTQMAMQLQQSMFVWQMSPIQSNLNSAFVPAFIGQQDHYPAQSFQVPSQPAYIDQLNRPITHQYDQRMTQPNQSELHLNQHYNQPIEQIQNQQQLNQPNISQTPQPLEQHQSAQVFPSYTDPQANSQRRPWQKHQSHPPTTNMQYPAAQSNQPELHLNQRYNQPIEQIQNQYQLNQPNTSQTPPPLEQHQSARVFPSYTDPQANSQRRSQQKHQSQPLITNTEHTETKQSQGHHQPARVFPSYTDQRTNSQEKYQQEQQLQVPTINKQYTFTSQSMPVYSQSSYQTPPSESITRTKIHPSRHVQQQTFFFFIIFFY